MFMMEVRKKYLRDSNMKLKDVINEFEYTGLKDKTMLKYKDPKTGEMDMMPAGSAKKLPDDHPAKIAYNKEKKVSDKFLKDKGKKDKPQKRDASFFQRKADKGSSGGRGLTAKQGLEDIVKGKTSSIEGIKMSKDLADGIQTWIRMSPYGKKYGKFINKGKIASLIRPANAFGLDRYLDGKTKKEFKAIYKSMKESVSSKLTDIIKK